MVGKLLGKLICKFILFLLVIVLVEINKGFKICCIKIDFKKFVLGKSFRGLYF